MKKLVSLISALTMCAVMAAPIASFAAEGEQEVLKNPALSADTAEITLSYTPEESYIITIPDTENMGDVLKNGITFKAEQVVLEDGQSITVTAKGSEKLTYTAKNGDVEEIPYTINGGDDNTLITAGNKDKEATKQFTIKLDDDAKAKAVYANPHEDQITFTVAVNDGTSVD